MYLFKIEKYLSRKYLYVICIFENLFSQKIFYMTKSTFPWRNKRDPVRSYLWSKKEHFFQTVFERIKYYL